MALLCRDQDLARVSGSQCFQRFASAGIESMEQFSDVMFNGGIFCRIDFCGHGLLVFRICPFLLVDQFPCHWPVKRPTRSLPNSCSPFGNPGWKDDVSPGRVFGPPDVRDFASGTFAA